MFIMSLCPTEFGGQSSPDMFAALADLPRWDSRRLGVSLALARSLALSLSLPLLVFYCIVFFSFTWIHESYGVFARSSDEFGPRVKSRQLRSKSTQSPAPGLKRVQNTSSPAVFCVSCIESWINHLVKSRFRCQNTERPFTAVDYPQLSSEMTQLDVINAVPLQSECW